MAGRPGSLQAAALLILRPVWKLFNHPRLAHRSQRGPGAWGWGGEVGGSRCIRTQGFNASPSSPRYRGWCGAPLSAQAGPQRRAPQLGPSASAPKAPSLPLSSLLGCPSCQGDFSKWPPLALGSGNPRGKQAGAPRRAPPGIPSFSPCQTELPRMPSGCSCRASPDRLLPCPSPLGHFPSRSPHLPPQKAPPLPPRSLTGQQESDQAGLLGQVELQAGPAEDVLHHGLRAAGPLQEGQELLGLLGVLGEERPVKGGWGAPGPGGGLVLGPPSSFSREVEQEGGCRRGNRATEVRNDTPPPAGSFMGQPLLGEGGGGTTHFCFRLGLPHPLLSGGKPLRPLPGWPPGPFPTDRPLGQWPELGS